MKKLTALLMSVMLAGALTLGACAQSTGGTSGSGGSGSGQLVTAIQMNATAFVQHAVQVKVNTPVTLDNTVGGGGTHILCVGTGTGGGNTCTSSGDGPSALYGSGNTVAPGTTTTITFAHTGDYRIICTLHPSMYVDVTVVS